MTRKDYRLIAKAISRSINKAEEDEHISFDVLITNLCGALRIDNPRFDSTKFIKACGGVK